MKPKLNFTAAVLPFALFVMVCLCCAPSTSHSQDLSSWFSSGTWWDWSDYRFKVEYRYFVPRLVSGTFSRNGTDYDLLASGGADANSGGYNFDAQPTPINSAVFQLQVDRLGLRLRVDEDLIFRGIFDSTTTRETTADPPTLRLSELDISSTRLGLDLDLVRYPFLRCGVDFDFNVNPVTFLDDKPHDSTRFYKSASPATLGLHVFAIPARIREVPIIVNAKISFPFPYWKQITSAQYETRMLEWEVMAGARPSVWDFSAFGHSTFSAGVEAGFRSVSIDAGLSSSASLKAQWQGPFFQFGFYY